MKRKNYAGKEPQPNRQKRKRGRRGKHARNSLNLDPKKPLNLKKFIK